MRRRYYALLLLSLFICAQLLCGCSGNPSKTIVGTWQHTNHWGDYEYTFYSDGYCKGTYYGRTGGVNPSMQPESYYEGSGDGYWSFVDDQLKIQYVGEEEGVMYYDYSFSQNRNELTIIGTPTYSGPEVAVWTRVGAEEEFDYGLHGGVIEPLPDLDPTH